MESFESLLGAPIIGVQWHPEGYDSNKDSSHSNLLRYMALAGQAYAGKRTIIQQIQEMAILSKGKDLRNFILKRQPLREK